MGSGHNQYLIRDLQGNFRRSLAFKNLSSISDKKQTTLPPAFSNNIEAALAVPPVANRSSTSYI